MQTDSKLKRIARSLRISRLSLCKKKGASISLGFMIAVVVILLNIGVKILFNINSNYDKQSESMDCEHDFIIMNKDTWKESFDTYLKEDQRIDEYEVRDCVDLKDVEIHYDGGTISAEDTIDNLNQQKEMNHLKLEDERKDIPEQEAIYVSKVMKTKGFHAGDEITFQNEIWSQTYKIAGFFSSTSRGIENCVALKFYLKEEAFHTLYLSKGVKTEILIRCKGIKDATPVYHDFMDYIKEHVESNDEWKAVWGCDYDLMRFGYSLMAKIGAAAVVGFAVIISLITLLVIHFRIQNNIEESIQKIGVLGALGYKSKEIALAFSGEYLFIAVIGSVAGFAFSYIALPLFGKTLMTSTGIDWYTSLQPGIDLSVIVLVIGIVYLTTRLTANRTKKYTPHVALAQGMTSHSFRKNTFPLDKKGNVLVRLAGKEWFQMKKQNIMLVLCMTGVTFAIVFASMMYNTFITDIALVTKMTGIELSDIQVDITDYTNPKDVQKMIDQMDGVRKTNLGGSNTGYLDGIAVAINSYEDFSKLETENVYEGRFCQYDNEVVITGALAKQLQKKIGDTVTVSIQESSYDFIITGLTQSMSDSGKMIKLTKEGYLRLVPSASLNRCYIYLKKGVFRKDFIAHVREYFGLKHTEEQTSDLYAKYQQIADEKMKTMMNIYGVKEMDYSINVDGMIISGNTRKFMIKMVTDNYEMGQSVLASMQFMLKIVTYAILTITAVIITILLAMIIKILLLKKKVHFGTLKALGYTSRQLMIQISISFMPAIIIGVMIGTVLCYFSAGKVTTLMLASVGITNMQFQVSIVTLMMVAASIILFSFLIAMLQAQKVRKVSVYGLLTE